MKNGVWRNGIADLLETPIANYIHPDQKVKKYIFKTIPHGQSFRVNVTFKK